MARKRAIRCNARFSDAEGIEAYETCGSLAKAALELGVSPGALAKRFQTIDYVPTPTKRTKQSDDVGRERRRKHAKKVRDSNRAAGRCLNETKFKRHAKPKPGKRKCDPCLEAHRKTR